MILPWLILIPFIGGLLCWQAERFGHVLPRWIALITMALSIPTGFAGYRSLPIKLPERVLRRTSDSIKIKFI